MSLMKLCCDSMPKLWHVQFNSPSIRMANVPFGHRSIGSAGKVFKSVMLPFTC